MPDEGPVIRRGALPVFAWALAWFVMGLCLHLSGVFNKPRTGPLWVAILGGMIPWALAGVFTFTKGSKFTLGLIWALAWLVSFGLAASLAVSLMDSIPGLLFGFALGPGAGAAASLLLSGSARPGRALLAGLLWGIGTFAGGWIGFFGIYAAPELAKYILGPTIGVPAALTLGYGIGAALGGLVAAGIALGLMRAVRTA